MNNPVIDKDGNQWYYNGLLHRDDGSATESPNGKKWWYFYGKECPQEEFILSKPTESH